MKTSNTRARKFRSTVGRIVMALVFASMIGGISIAPAFGYDHGRREWRHGRYWHGRPGYYYPPGYYPPPVYAPPPVVYPPYPYASPGINFVFPLHIR